MLNIEGEKSESEGEIAAPETSINPMPNESLNLTVVNSHEKRDPILQNTTKNEDLMLVASTNHNGIDNVQFTCNFQNYNFNPQSLGFTFFFLFFVFFLVSNFSFTNRKLFLGLQNKKTLDVFFRLTQTFSKVLFCVVGAKTQRYKKFVFQKKFT